MGWFQDQEGEVAATLVTVLNGLNDDSVAGLSSLEVTDVRFKTKKRPKKGKWESGDVFAGKLPDNTYAFCRVLHNDEKHGNTLVEFFRCRSTKPRLPLPIARLHACCRP